MFDKLFAVRSSSPPSVGAGSYAGSRRSAAGINVSESTALTLGAVYSAVKTISETIAMIPWRDMESRGDTKTIIAGSALDDLLHKQANPEVAAFQFREYMLRSALLHGNGYAEIERSVGGEAIALWPFHPESVTPKRDKAGNLYYEVRQDGGSTVPIASENMFHLRGPTSDGIVGMSTISIAAEAWGLGIAEQRFAASFLGNGATPGTVIQAGEGSPSMDIESINNMLESFDSRLRGSGKAGRTAFIESGFELKQVSVSQKDAQFIEGRKHTVTDVARWFRLPPHKIGDLERATFSNIESQETTFVTSAIMPWTVRLEQEAAIKLVTRQGQFTRLVLLGLLRGDSEARSKYYTQMRDLGVLSINEIRALEDMDPIDVGDLRLVPLNMVSVNRAGDPTPGRDTSAARAVVVETYERMSAKEANARSRAESKGTSLGGWAESFYPRHTEQLTASLATVCSAYAEAVGVSADVAPVVGEHCRKYRDAATRAAEWGVATPSAESWSSMLIAEIEGLKNVQ